MNVNGFVVIATFWCLVTNEGKRIPYTRESEPLLLRRGVAPSHIRKQYIDTYGGNLAVNGGDNTITSSEVFGDSAQQQNYVNEENQIQGNMLQGDTMTTNNGLMNDLGANQANSLTNEFASSNENTEGSQFIGNGPISGMNKALDMAAFAGGSENSVGPGFGNSLGASLDNSLNGGDLGGSFTSDNRLGLGGGTVDIGGNNQGFGALNDGSHIGGGLGSFGGSETFEGGLYGGGNGLGDGGLDSNGLGENSLGDGKLYGGSFGESSIGGGSFGVGGTGGGSFHDATLDGSFSDNKIDESNVGGNAFNPNELGDIDGGLGNNLGGVGGLNGIDGMNGGLGASLSNDFGLDALGSKIATGSKVEQVGSLGPSHHTSGLNGLLGNNEMLNDIASNNHMPSDMQLSNAVDENPAMIHTGLASILPGKTVHAHVSDKPSNKKPGISKPSVNAALQVQNEAKKQHEKRLEALKIKLKKLRERLEKLQQVGTKQDKIESRKEKDVEEIKTLNELRVATKDAIKELHDDYPRAKKKQLTSKQEHESSKTKLKTVDITAKETGDTLEQLLKLLDPEIQNKKRGNVNKLNHTRLDKKAKSKLASLTKKAEDGVGKLTTQEPTIKTVPQLRAPKVKIQALHGKQKSFKEKLKNERIQKATKSLKYISLGCWRDDPDRIVPSLENTSNLLKDGYRIRQDSIKKCAQVAHEQGFVAFALENGGQCFAGSQLLQRYKIYGHSMDCGKDGRGGDYAMEVYVFQ